MLNMFTLWETELQSSFILQNCDAVPIRRLSIPPVTILLSASMNLSTFPASCKWNRTVFALLWMAYVT